jgi:hypothetical protein
LGIFVQKAFETNLDFRNRRVKDQALVFCQFDVTTVPLIFYSFIPRIEICPKCFLDKNFQKQSLIRTLFCFFVRYDVKVILFNPGDHPGETPLCFGQGVHYEAMREEVTLRFSKCTKVLEDFENHKDKFVKTFSGMPALKKLDSPGLYKAFDKIIMDVRPKKFYINSPIKTRSFFGFLNCIPWAWSDKARLALMRLPK